MRILGKVLTVFLLFVFLYTAPSTADIISAKIQSHKRDTILISDFQYSHSGCVSLAVSSVRISSIPVTSNLSSQPDPSRIGFFLLSNELQYRYDQKFEQNPDLCALDINLISVLFTFQNLSNSFNKSYNVTYPGEYFLYFTNCNDLSLVTMDVGAELYNTDDDGTIKDYLSAEQPQPSYYFKFFYIYPCFLGFWISLCIMNRRYFQKIHLLMCLLLVMAFVNCICAAADQQDLKVTGTRHGWHVLFYISQFMRSVLLFSVVLLICTGWCIWQPSFPVWVICSLTIVILLQIWANLSGIVVGEFGVFNKEMDSRDSFKSVDAVCCIFVVYHVIGSAVMFRVAEDTSSFVRSFNSLKETSARPDVLSVLFLVYMFFRLMTEETCNFVFYVVMFYMFRPFDLDDINEYKVSGYWSLGDRYNLSKLVFK